MLRISNGAGTALFIGNTHGRGGWPGRYASSPHPRAIVSDLLTKLQSLMLLPGNGVATTPFMANTMRSSRTLSDSANPIVFTRLIVSDFAHTGFQVVKQRRGNRAIIW